MTLTDRADKLRRVASDINVAPLVSVLSRTPDLWDQITARQKTPGSPHRDTQCIFIRGPREQTIHAVFNDIEAIDYPALAMLDDAVVPVIQEIAKHVPIKKLGRVMITSLKTNGMIARHMDQGAYAEHYSRYHLALQSDEGNVFECDDETAHMLPGELWWFNHRVPHSVYNASGAPRLHLIVDVVSA